MTGESELEDWALAWLLRISELYCLNRERLRHVPGTSERVAADFTLQQHMATMAAQRDSELAVKKLRQPCRKVLQSLTEHWDGLTLFVNDSRIPMDNNSGERLMRGPAVGRKNYYGSGAEWSGRLKGHFENALHCRLIICGQSRIAQCRSVGCCEPSDDKPPRDLAEIDTELKIVTDRILTMIGGLSK